MNLLSLLGGRSGMLPLLNQVNKDVICAWSMGGSKLKNKKYRRLVFMH